MNDKISPKFQKYLDNTNRYLEKRHDEIIARHRQGHTMEKIASDMKLQHAVVRASLGTLKKEETEINELSNKIIHRYVKKARSDIKKGNKIRNRYSGIRQAKKKLHREENLNELYGKGKLEKIADYHAIKSELPVLAGGAWNKKPHEKSWHRAINMLVARRFHKPGQKSLVRLKKEETEINELAQSTYRSYVKKAAGDIRDVAYMAGMRDASNPRHAKYWEKANKRVAGVHKALSKIKEDTIRKVVQEKVQSFFEADSATGSIGTNWAGNQASNMGNGLPIKATKDSPPKKQNNIPGEDQVKLGGITPVIFNPTMKDSENKTDTKDINLKQDTTVLKKNMNEMTLHKANKIISKFWGGKKVKNRKLNKALNVKADVLAGERKRGADRVRRLKANESINEDDLTGLVTAAIGIPIGLAIRHHYKKKAEKLAALKAASKTGGRKKAQNPVQPQQQPTKSHRWGGDTRMDQLGINALKRHLANRRAKGVASFPPPRGQSSVLPPVKTAAAGQQQLHNFIKSKDVGPWGPHNPTTTTGPKVKQGVPRRTTRIEKDRADVHQTAQNDLVQLRANIKQHAAERAKSFNKTEWEKKWGTREAGHAALKAANTPEKYHAFLQRDWPEHLKTPYKPIQTQKTTTPKKPDNVVKLNSRMNAKDFNQLLKQKPGLKIRAGGVHEEMNEEKYYVHIRPQGVIGNAPRGKHLIHAVTKHKHGYEVHTHGGNNTLNVPHSTALHPTKHKFTQGTSSMPIGLDYIHSQMKKRIKEEMNMETVRRVLKEAFHKKGGGKMGIVSKGKDTEGDTHPINIFRKAENLKTSVPLVHHNKEKTHVTPELAKNLLNQYGNLQKPHEKEHMINQVWGSSQGLHDYAAGKKHVPKVHWALKNINRT